MQPKLQAKLEILHKVARSLNSSVDLNEVLQQTLVQVAELLGLETGWIFLLDPEEKPYLAASLNLPPGLSSEPQRMTGSCYCLDLFRENRLETARNIQMITCSRLYDLTTGSEGLRFHASIPLQTGEKKLGVMNVASRQKPALSPAELNTLYTVGDLLSLAIERTQFYAESLKLSALSERYHLARELHDSLGQGLTALILQMEILDALVDKGASAEKLKAQIAQGQHLARRNLHEARQTVQSLRSEPSQAPPLSQFIQQQVRESLPQIQFEMEGEIPPLSAVLQSGLARILQELFTNIAKHAQAKTLKISFTIKSNHLTVLVEDDGLGFEPNTVKPGHFGLIGVRERLHLLQGRLQICSVPQLGTQIWLQVPLEMAATP